MTTLPFEYSDSTIERPVTLPYVYRVRTIEKVTDGDTYWLHLDVGFRQTILAHLRLNDYDTPELRRGDDYEKAQARIATDVVGDWLTRNLAEPDTKVWARTEKDPDSFGRWLVILWFERGDEVEWVHGVLLDQDLAVESPGGKVKWRDVHGTPA